jgi:hypothetical protein
MKRWILLAGLVVLLTAAATVAVQFLPEEETPRGGVAYPAGEGKAGPQPKAVVEGELTYRFGAAPQYTKLLRDWMIKNTGQAELEVRIGPPACSCTIAKFPGDKETTTLKPNETVAIHLSFDTRDYNGKYHKSATVNTNDPERQVIEFAADGEVRPAVAIFPEPTVNFLEISNDEPDHRRTVAVISPDRPDLKITKLETSRPEILATDEPLSEEDCKQLKAPGGRRVLLNIKSGMPLGSFREEVIVHVDHPRQPDVRLTLLGRVVGPITVSPSLLRITDASSSQGKESDVKIVVRSQRPTKFEVVKKPGPLMAKVVHDEKAARGGLYRLLVTVPPGTPPGNIEGQIVLKTDHPLASEVKIPVQIFVQDAG